MRRRARRTGRIGRAEKLVLTGLAVSLVAHVLVLILTALLSIERGGDGRFASGDEGEIELALLTEQDLAELAADVPAVTEPDVAEAELEVPELETLSEASFETPSLAEALLSSDSELAAGGLSGEIGESLAGGGVGGSGASFFGVEAKGQRFAYIVDRSGSMRGAKLERLRRELLSSVGELGGGSEFFVVLYNSSAQPLSASLEWEFASSQAKRRLPGQLQRDLTAEGGTNPVPAFGVVLRELDPPPDAIFFMTDAESFGDEVPNTIAQMNRRARVPIHSILFGDFDSTAERNRIKRVLDEIARRSGGSSVFRRARP